MGDCLVTPEAAQAIFAKDQNRIQGKIAMALAANSPFVSVLKPGTFPAAWSDTQKAIVEEQAAANDSLVNPTFSTMKDVCGPVSGSEKTGKTSYEYSVGLKRGFGPKICVNAAFSAYQASLINSYDALKKLIVQYINADVRYNLLSKSGVKAVAKTGVNFSSLVTGGYGQVDASFAPYTPDAALSFKYLHRLSQFLKEEMLADMFGEGADAHYRFIGSAQQIEIFRNELGVKQDLVGLATGNDKLGLTTLKAYQFEGPYRQIKFGIDQRPLRLDANLDYVEPLVTTAVSIGEAGRPNPNWVAAPYEVSFLMGQGSFERLVPERFVGEGEFKFAAQLFGGELQWHYVIDNDCNPFGDTGYHKYQIGRAYRPIRPFWVLPILHARCADDLGLAVCSTSLGGTL